MSTPESPIFDDAPRTVQRQPQPIVIQTSNGFVSRWTIRLLAVLLGFSVLFNIGLFSAWSEYYSAAEPPTEKYVSGSRTGLQKIARITISGTIMPPFTERWIEQIQAATEADAVKGVLLVVDSPGGLVADSHQIYHELGKLRAKKPIYVAMQRMAASGGYYVAMGAGPQGKIFAEPTTWTGSIGVIMPRYEFGDLASKLGIKSAPLKTGEFKDALNPFEPLSESERELWMNILDQSFQQFLQIIDENRETLDLAGVKKLATGQIYTAKDAKANGLVDQIGFEDEAIAALQAELGGKDYRVVEYESPSSLMDVLMGQAQAQAPNPLETLLESAVPRAWFFCSGLAPASAR